MYELTPRMVQSFKNYLIKFHELFGGGRCAAWQQEELIVKAIKSDTQAQHQVFWTEAGHDDHADIRVRVNGGISPIQIKSGSIKNNKLILSGYRLGRFHGDLEAITGYLNHVDSDVISVPYYQINGTEGRIHVYEICYVGILVLRCLQANEWGKAGNNYVQVNKYDVEFSIRPSMSWQVWWAVPLSVIKRTNEIRI